MFVGLLIEAKITVHLAFVHRLTYAQFFVAAVHKH